MIRNMTTFLTRYCKGCKAHKPVAGGTTGQRGKGFRCAGCKPCSK